MALTRPVGTLLPSIMLAGIIIHGADAGHELSENVLATLLNDSLLYLPVCWHILHDNLMRLDAGSSSSASVVLVNEAVASAEIAGAAAAFYFFPALLRLWQRACLRKPRMESPRPSVRLSVFSKSLAPAKMGAGIDRSAGTSSIAPSKPCFNC